MWMVISIPVFIYIHGDLFRSTHAHTYPATHPTIRPPSLLDISPFFFLYLFILVPTIFFPFSFRLHIYHFRMYVRYGNCIARRSRRRSFFFFLFLYKRHTHTSGDRQAGRMKGGLGGYRVLLVGWLWDFGFPGLSGRVSGRLIG